MNVQDLNKHLLLQVFIFKKMFYRLLLDNCYIFHEINKFSIHVMLHC